MCGRFTHRFTWSELHDLYGLTSPAVELPISYNVAPTQTAPVVRQSGQGRTIAMLRWGLVPSWADDERIGSRLINARCETLATKPSFRWSLRHRRCVVPVSGFYEWAAWHPSGPRQPFYITPASSVGTVLTLAGLWDRWESPKAESIESFTIITTIANQAIAPVHDRMPVILGPHEVASWLSPETPSEALASVLRPCPSSTLTIQPVSTLVNSPRHNTPACIEPVAL